ncbi:MAG TPA: alcohol dehydrogenase [Caldithrix sp.]|nr:alcohol dehydrogenase [Caldithrix sp.]
MKALHFDGKNLSLVEKSKPVPAKGEALVRVVYAGICNTDLEIMKGYMGFRGTPGHEFVGIVEQAETAELVGKRVVGEINLACGKCGFCRQGLERHCPNRTVLGIAGKDGAFAEYLTLPEQNLHPVARSISDLQAVFTEPLAAACEIPEQLHILPDYRVLLLGDGKLAQFIARVLHLHSAHLLVVGKHPEKLNRLKERGIATCLLDDFKEPDQSFQVVVEATGSWGAWELALKKVRPRGVLVLKSTYAGENRFNPAAIVIQEITVIGSRCGPFNAALHLMENNLIDPSDLLTRVFPVSEWRQAFELAKNPESLKVVLEF